MTNIDDLAYKLPLAHIVCHDSKGVIGDSALNAMPWKCSGELKYFQKISMNKILIMGYNTYASIIAHGSVFNNEHILSIDPVLKGRICVVIADPIRTQYPEYTISNTQDVSYLLNKGVLPEGLTTFVPNLREAVECAGMISCVIREYISNRLLGKEWYRGAGDPVGYIVGGGKIYNESLQHYNVTEIFETKLPIATKVGKGEIKYPAISDTVYMLIDSQIQKHDIRLGNITYRRSDINFNYWKKRSHYHKK